MKSLSQPLRWILVLIAVASCQKPVDHNPVLAAQKAVEFARVAFVRRDDAAAYELLSNATRRYVPLDKFKETLSRLRPSSRPSKITATE